MLESKNLFVITGPPGGGKTPLVGELARLGYGTVAEPARAVLAEQRATGGRGTHDQDARLFFELMLQRAVGDFGRSAGAPRPVFFDRAIPDLIGYAELFGHDPSDAEGAAAAHRYAEAVLVLPSWPEIYTTDDERNMTFEFAAAFGDRVREIYVRLGYEIVDIPRDTIEARAKFVIDALQLG